MNTIYTNGVIASLELGWGEGWLSPGGNEELELLLDAIEIRGKTILDIGVGTGGPALALLSKFGAAHVTGIDVEQPVIDRALELARIQQLQSQLDLHCVKSGPLPFKDEKFDVVFSKDCFVHIADKRTLFDEIYRVLMPNGILVFSDWCCGAPPYSFDMEQYLENGMDFSMATAGDNIDNMVQSGFSNIYLRDRNEWFAEYAEREYREAIGSKREQMVGMFGEEKADSIAAAAKRRAKIGAQGYLRPTHFISRKD
jgi:ubiquinone/menaquinone biosynthesis C-methylase UbiE